MAPAAFIVMSLLPIHSYPQSVIVSQVSPGFVLPSAPGVRSNFTRPPSVADISNWSALRATNLCDCLESIPSEAGEYDLHQSKLLLSVSVVFRKKSGRKVSVKSSFDSVRMNALKTSWSFESENAMHPGLIGLGSMRRKVIFESAAEPCLDTSTARIERTFPSSNTLHKKLRGAFWCFRW